MNNVAALVVGASGAIGQAICAELRAQQPKVRITGVCRQPLTNPLPKVNYQHGDLLDESFIRQVCQDNPAPDWVFVCTGTLHNQAVFPEKRLEDINAAQLQTYFAINSVLPALWLKHLVRGFSKQSRAQVVMLSARVGSISDNQLGGWYGYRASKAALNMLVKSAWVEYQRRAPGVNLLCYHPGTVNSALSEPFQTNVPKGKLFTPEFTASQLFSFLPKLTAEKGPYYLDWQGKQISW